MELLYCLLIHFRVILGFHFRYLNALINPDASSCLFYTVHRTYANQTSETVIMSLGRQIKLG